MKMKKFLNAPENIRQEMLEGLALANPDTIFVDEAGLVINKNLSCAERVTVVSLGGIGHEPAISGFVGEGILDISVPGTVFAAPGPQLCLDALKLADRGKGTLFVVLSHAGDLLSGNMAMRLAEKAGMNVKMLVTQEDIFGAPSTRASQRRGLVGCVPVYKIAGAAAVKGYNLEQVYSVANHFAENMASISVAIRGATHPVTGTEISILGDDEMEIGVGQHGEDGGHRQKFRSADETAEIMVQSLIDNLSLKSGERVMLIINGSGATSVMEMLIVYRAAYRYLEQQGICVVAGMADEILTVQETAGFQMFLARMDDELLDLWRLPCRSPYFTK
jgi:dihydroxyacetone kinase-like protein